MEYGEALVTHLLHSVGYEVHPIAAAHDARRADLLATSPNDHLVIEVKHRVRDRGYEQALAQTGSAERSEVLSRSNRVSNQVKSASRQLDSTPVADDSVRLVALVATKRSSHAVMHTFRSTLYGSVDVVTPDEAGAAVAIPCVFFGFSDFFRHRNLDGAILATETIAQLCVNPFGRPDALRRTDLYRTYSTQKGVFDPEELEADGEVFIADTSLDRSDQAAVLAYVRDKYNLPPFATTVTWTHFNASVARKSSLDDPLP
jgi:hypothetical protein